MKVGNLVFVDKKTALKESREMQTMVNQKADGLSQDVNERFKKLEVRELIPMMELPHPTKKMRQSKPNTCCIIASSWRCYFGKDLLFLQVFVQYLSIHQPVSKQARVLSELGSGEAGEGKARCGDVGMDLAWHVDPWLHLDPGHEGR